MRRVVKHSRALWVLEMSSRWVSFSTTQEMRSWPVSDSRLTRSIKRATCNELLDALKRLRKAIEFPSEDHGNSLLALPLK
jgi:hypothetical protein